MTYTVNSASRVVRVADGAHLPASWCDGRLVVQDEQAESVQELLAWLSMGNQLQPHAPSVAEHNAPILAEMLANDLKVLRALAERDDARIAAHNARQATLRARLRK